MENLEKKIEAMNSKFDWFGRCIKNCENQDYAKSVNLFEGYFVVRERFLNELDRADYSHQLIAENDQINDRMTKMMQEWGRSLFIHHAKPLIELGGHTVSDDDVNDMCTIIAMNMKSLEDKNISEMNKYLEAVDMLEEYLHKEREGKRN